MITARTDRMPAAEEIRRESRAPNQLNAGALQRVTVNVTARGARELQNLAELTGYSKTDVINRAISVYSFVEETLRSGGEIHIRRGPDDDLEKLTIL